MHGFRGHRESSRSPPKPKSPRLLRSPRQENDAAQDLWKSEGNIFCKMGGVVRKSLCLLLIVLLVGLYTFVLDFVRALPGGRAIVVSVNHDWIDRTTQTQNIVTDIPPRISDGGEEAQMDDGDEDDLYNMDPDINSAIVEEHHTRSWRRMGHAIVENRTCATVEEMGNLTVGSREGVDSSSLRIRRLIHRHFALHGAEYVRQLPARKFCRRGFVAETLEQKGLGNCLYRTISAAGLSIMLGRSLILSEVNAFNSNFSEGEGRFAFQDYISTTREAFTLREVKQLWLKHKCNSTYGRPLRVRTYDFRTTNRTTELCDDWSKLTEPIIRFTSAEDSVALQTFLKSRVPGMRLRAYRLFGPTNNPDLRPNTFGELLNYVHAPTLAIEEAVNWTLGGGGDPDIAVHLRIMHLMDEASDTSAWCVKQVLAQFPELRAGGRKPRVAVVSDTAAAVVIVREALGSDCEVVHFDYKAWMEAFPNHKTMNSNKTRVPEGRALDWGPAPRWVGIVDFYLAARARVAVISGARRRVATTFVQLAAASAGSRQLREHGAKDEPPFAFYSSFQVGLLRTGLLPQSGRSFAWHPFATNLSCTFQRRQCALTALSPYTWFDAPWQAPGGMYQMWQNYGFAMTYEGEVTPEAREDYCNRTSGNSVSQIATISLPDGHIS